MVAIFGNDHIGIVPFRISKDEVRLLGKKGSETSQDKGQRVKVAHWMDLSCPLIMFPRLLPVHSLSPRHVGKGLSREEDGLGDGKWGHFGLTNPWQPL